MFQTYLSIIRCVRKLYPCFMLSLFNIRCDQ